MIPKILLLFVLFSSTFIYAAVGDELVVTGFIVHLRAEPSRDSSSLLRLAEGRLVDEIETKGNWVKVNTGRDDVPIGWILKSLVERKQEKNPATAEMPFELFELAFAEFQENIQSNQQATFFLAVNDLGGGELQVISTPAWIQRTEFERLQDMEKIFQIWKAVKGDQSSLLVTIVDQKEELLLSILR